MPNALSLGTKLSGTISNTTAHKFEVLFCFFPTFRVGSGAYEQVVIKR